MATHSSIPAWRTPWTGEPGGPCSFLPYVAGTHLLPAPHLVSQSKILCANVHFGKTF